MIKISGTGGVNIQAEQTNIAQAVDAESKNIQNQIARAQQKLQELASNEELSVEEKVKKRQELRQQINDLNNQLRQHQLEQRKEKQQEKGDAAEELSDTAETDTTGAGDTGFSSVRMKALISADQAMRQAQAYGSVTNRMEGRAGSLQAEIQADGARGIPVERKEAELAKVEKRAANAASSQLNTLGTVTKEIKDVWKTEQQEKRTKGVGTAGTGQAETADTVKWKVSTETEEPAGSVKKAGSYSALDLRF